MEHPEGIPGAVSDGQNYMITINIPAICLYAGNSITIRQDTSHLSAKPHLATQADDAFAQILYHIQQHIRAHMGLGIVQNILTGTRFDKLLQNPADPGIIDTRIQLAIGKSTCATLTELYIADFVQLTGSKEFLHLFMPCLGILTPFQNDGL